MPLPFGPEPPVEPRPRHARQGDDTRRPDPARGEARRWPTGRDVRRGLGLLKIDRRAGEVWIQGRRVRLQEQPYRVLLALVDAPGETVTREELCARLWPAQTYVDFDNGLNNIVSRLRAALGDATQWPCFIETVGRRGYRFIGDALFMSPAIRPGGRTDRPAAGRVTPAAAASADRGASPAHPGAGVPGAWPRLRHLSVRPLTAHGANGDLLAYCVSSAIVRALGGPDTPASRGAGLADGRAVRAWTGPGDDPASDGHTSLDAVLSGAVSNADGSVIVALELRDEGSGKPIWRRSFERPAHELHPLAADVVDAVREQVTKGARALAACRPGGSAPSHWTDQPAAAPGESER